MKLTDLENVLNHIRVNHYHCLDDQADHLQVAFINTCGRRDVDIMIFDSSRFGISKTFNFTETLEELKKLQENA